MGVLFLNIFKNLLFMKFLRDVLLISAIFIRDTFHVIAKKYFLSSWKELARLEKAYIIFRFVTILEVSRVKLMTSTYHYTYSVKIRNRFLYFTEYFIWFESPFLHSFLIYIVLLYSNFLLQFFRYFDSHHHFLFDILKVQWCAQWSKWNDIGECGFTQFWFLGIVNAL